MGPDEIKSKIKEVVGGMFDMEPKSVPDAKPFTQMAKYDSMRALEFLAKLETEFDVMIDPDQLPNMATVEKAAQVIQGYLDAK